MTNQRSRDDSTADPRDVPHYAKVEVKCPICGNRDFSDGHDEPAGPDAHYRNVFCEGCGTLLSIEFVPVDVRHYWDREEAEGGPEWVSGVESDTSDVFPQYVAYDADGEGEP